MHVIVEVLQEADDATLGALQRLLPQVSSSAPALSRERVEAVLSNPFTDVLVARGSDGVVLGMALLGVLTTLQGQSGLVEEVAVDAEARGKHVSVHLMVGLLRRATERGLDFVELTSRPSREAANSLYQKLGFIPRETNVYRHTLSPLPTPW